MISLCINDLIASSKKRGVQSPRVEAIVQKCTVTSSVYEDKDFPPSTQSLDGRTGTI